jgi:hypothetical protein
VVAGEEVERWRREGKRRSQRKNGELDSVLLLLPHNLNSSYTSTGRFLLV